MPVLCSLNAGNGCGGNLALSLLYFMTTLCSVAYKQLISHIFMAQNATILLLKVKITPLITILL